MIDAADQKFLDLAIEQARVGWQEGGIPIGAALVHEGEVLAVGRNRRIQMGSSIRHGETDCIENAGRLSARTAVLYDIPRIVIGENRTFEASESWLASRGVELVIADDAECRALMDKMIAEKPELWAEDIGEEA